MRLQSSDTPLHIEQILIEGYRRMTPTQKLDRVRAMTLAIQELAMAQIRTEHPEAPQREMELRLAARWLPPEIMSRVFGWDVRSRGY